VKNTLRERFLHSLSWALGGNLTGQLLRFGGNLVMTRLLAPDDFGLMAIVMVLITGVTLFSDLGAGQFVIHSQKGTDIRFRHTAWTLQVIRGFYIWGATALLGVGVYIAGRLGAFPEGSTYQDPRLPWVVGVFASQMAILGFISSKQWLQQRDLDMRKIMLVRVFSQLLGLVVMIAWGYFYRDVWALVVAGLISTLAQVVASHTLLPGEPDRFRWDKGALSELLGFGRWVLLSSIVGFLATNGDRMLLGGLEDAHALGIYSIAFLLLSPIQSMFTTTTGSVIFPALSEVVRESPEKLTSVYLKFQRMSDLALVSLAGILVTGGEAAVSVLYDARYIASGEMLSVLALTLVGMRTQVYEQVFMANGQSKITSMANLLRLVGLFVMVPVLHHFGGLAWAVWGVAASPFMAWPLVYILRHRAGVSAWRADAFMVPAFLGGTVLGWLASQLVNHLRPLT
jgi:O-antigen/teichoic acid export membrane protein